MAAIGLQSHIWNNNLKSVALISAYPFLIALMVWAIATAVGWAYSYEQGSATNWNRVFEFGNSVILNCWPYVFGAVGVWFLVSYFFHTRMMRMLSHSHPVTRKEEPELYNLLENLCITQGMKTPKFEIIETHARNAFASGIDERSYTVTVTRGLLQSLSKDEVEAVLAHELTHIINQDVRLLMVSIIFTGMLGFAAELTMNSLRYGRWSSGGGGKGKGNAIIVILIIIAVIWIGYMLTLFTRFMLSRSREYMADAGAVQMTKNPDAMMRALKRIAGMDQIPGAADDVAMMCVENKKKFMGLFATHPPIEKRIQSISDMTDTPIPHIKPKERVSGPERFAQPVEGRDNWNSKQRREKNPWLSKP